MASTQPFSGLGRMCRKFASSARGQFAPWDLQDSLVKIGALLLCLVSLVGGVRAQDVAQNLSSVQRVMQADPPIPGADVPDARSATTGLDIRRSSAANGNDANSGLESGYFLRAWSSAEDMPAVVPLLLLTTALALSLAQSVATASYQIYSRLSIIAPKIKSARSVPPGARLRDYEADCRAKLSTVGSLWHDAESSVMQLSVDHPLRKLLESELSVIGWRLSMYPRLDHVQQGAIAKSYSAEYWRLLYRELSRANRELNRISAVASAGRESMGGRSSGPQMPRTIDEAYFVLGVNADVNDETLKRLVRALRQCWHPDLAQNESDRNYRETRIRQINVANDIIAGRADA